MGSWGTGIFDGDDAIDVRERYTQLIAQKADPISARETVLSEFCHGEPGNPDNNSVVLSLAATAHDLGIADVDMTRQAFKIIESPDELARWEPESPARSKALESLRQELEAELPPPRSIKPKKFRENPYTVGQHFLFIDESSGSKLLLRVVGEDEGTEGRYPRFTVLDWDGNGAGLRKPSALSPLRTDTAIFKHQIYLAALIVGRRLKKSNLLEIPDVTSVDSDYEHARHVMPWSYLVQHVRDAAVSVPKTIVPPAQ